MQLGWGAGREHDLTIIYDKMDPLTPISEPTVVNSGLSSMNPSATSANPEYAFNTVITTAIKKSVSSFIQFKDFKDRPLTHVSTTDGGGRRETLQETEHRVCGETPGCDCRCARRHGYERAHRRHVSAKERAVYKMSAGKSQWAGGHASSKL